MAVNSQNADYYPTALIVEDNADLANVFSFALREAGFEIDTVLDGQAAMLRLATITPEVIVLDLHLPHVSGREILNYVLADDRFSDTQIIIASADHHLAKELENEDIIVLIKPVSFKQLRDLSTRLKFYPNKSGIKIPINSVTAQSAAAGDPDV